MPKQKEAQKDYYALDTLSASLPSDWYYDSTHHEKEMQAVWYQNWLYVCPAEQLATTGTYQTVQVNNQNILIIRDGQQTLKAYYNTCRHRGSVLCTKRHGTLTTRFLVCPYHQWTYALDNGQLHSTSSFRLPDNFNATDYGLLSVSLKVWRGLIFINLKANATWHLNKVFQSYDSVLDAFPLENMVLGHSWHKKIKCNWKIYWENYSECLHCPNLHPELSGLVPVYSRRLVDVKDVPDWRKSTHKGAKYQSGLKKGAETWSLNGSAQNGAIATVAKNPLFNGQSYSTTWPAMFLGAYVDHIRLVRLLPIDSETTELSAHWLFEKKTLNNKHYQFKNVTDFAKMIMTQDGHACELNQKGLHNKAYKQGVLMPEEYTIKAFHHWLKGELKQTLRR